MALTTSRPAEAAEAGNAVYAVTYFEAAPADASKVATEVKEYVAASRKEAGNLAVAAFEESVARAGSRSSPAGREQGGSRCSRWRSANHRL